MKIPKRRPSRMRSFLVGLAVGCAILAIALLVTLVAATYLKERPFSSSQSKHQSHTYNPPTRTGVSQPEVVSMTNTYRQTKSLQPLRESELLNASACHKADDMIARDYWSHDAPDGTKPWVFFQKVGYGYQKAGENLAYGFTSARSTVDGWINSPTHEANLVGDYTELGMCVRGPVQYQGGEHYVIVAHYGTPL